MRWHRVLGITLLPCDANPTFFIRRFGGHTPEPGEESASSFTTCQLPQMPLSRPSPFTNDVRHGPRMNFEFRLRIATLCVHRRPQTVGHSACAAISHEHHHDREKSLKSLDLCYIHPIPLDASADVHPDPRAPSISIARKQIKQSVKFEAAMAA